MPRKHPRNKAGGNRKTSGVRIISGKWRGRRLPVADVEGLRPSSDRLRETLFNWLQPMIDGANCLDLFAGTGALSFEALSRGASNATLIEQNRVALRGLHEARDMLAAENTELHHADAIKLTENTPTFAHAPYDLIFVDPPWSIFSQQTILRNISDNQWLKANALIYVEMPKNMELLPPPQLHEINRKTMGEALALLFCYKKTQ